MNYSPQWRLGKHRIPQQYATSFATHTQHTVTNENHDAIVERKLTFCSELALFSLVLLLRETDVADKLVRPDLTHVLRTDLMQLATAVIAHYEPTTSNITHYVSHRPQLYRHHCITHRTSEPSTYFLTTTTKQLLAAYNGEENYARSGWFQSATSISRMS